MGTLTASYSFELPTIGGDANLWGSMLNTNWTVLDDLLSGSQALLGLQVDGNITISSDNWAVDGGWLLTDGSAANNVYRPNNVAGSFLLRMFSDVFSTGGEVCRVRNDGALANVTGAYSMISDARVKEDIIDANSQVDDFKQLRIVNYKMKGKEEKLIGVIAQEVLQVKPGLVDIDEDGVMSFKLTIMIPIMMKVLQEVIDRLEKLEKK